MINECEGGCGATGGVGAEGGISTLGNTQGIGNPQLPTEIAGSPGEQRDPKTFGSGDRWDGFGKRKKKYYVAKKKNGKTYKVKEGLTYDEAYKFVNGMGVPNDDTLQIYEMNDNGGN